MTGTRAEYGLLYWLMKEIEADPDLDLQLAVTGMHLSPEFGLTYRRIEDDGFTIDAKVEMLLSSDTPVGIAKSTALGVAGFADALATLQPDLLVVLGDRFEIFAAAQAALIARIPIAHIHGGEITEGAIDDAIRHSITKMAHLHFVSAEPHLRRVVQLGEDPARVYNVGAPGIDNIRKLELLGREALEAALGIKLRPPVFLVTYHPVTLDRRSPAVAARALCDALSQRLGTVIITKANADTGGRIISEVFDEFAARHTDRAVSITSLGQLRYLSAMSQADVVVGNSSSGLIEAPALKKATVNLGDRQRGRLKASSVIDCEEDAASIESALEEALSDDFRRKLANVASPYGDGGASNRIKDVLKTANLDGILMKSFYDVAGADPIGSAQR